MRVPSRLCVLALLVTALGSAAFGHAAGPAKRDAEPAKVDNPAAPPSTDLLDTLARTEKYKLFLEAVSAAGMEGELRKRGPFTVFVPTDEAFRKLPADTLDMLLADKPRMTAILQGHIVPGHLSIQQLSDAKTAKTLSRTTLRVVPAQGDLPPKVENANIVTTDLETTNGVVHAVDVVLMPK